MDLKNYLTIPAAAEELGLTHDTLRKYCHRGLIPSVKIGWTLLLHRRDVRKFAATHVFRRKTDGASPSLVST